MDRFEEHSSGRRDRPASARRIVLAVTHEISARSFYRGFTAVLREAGWETLVVTGSQGGLEDFGLEEGTAVADVPMRREPAPLDDLVSLWRWVRLLLQEKPDLVVAGTPKAGMLGMVSARLVGVPTRIYHMRGLRLETETGPRRAVFRLLERLTVSSATLVLSNSASLIDAMREEGVLGKTPIVVAGRGSSQGVDLAHFRSDDAVPRLPDSAREFWADHDGALRILTVGRLQVDKGLDTLVDAIDLLERRGVRTATVMVGGPEDPVLLERLEGAARRLPILLAGSADDPRPYYREAQVLCHPSRREGFPNVVLEAAAMARPAVVADSTGTVDSVEDEVTGMIVPTDDAEAFADALERMARDATFRELLGAGARRHVEEHFNRRDVWAAQAEIFDQAFLNPGHVPGASAELHVMGAS